MNLLLNFLLMTIKQYGAFAFVIALMFYIFLKINGLKINGHEKFMNYGSINDFLFLMAMTFPAL